jgi:hypothetical protein
MVIATGYCTLVFDGQRVEKLSCTLDLAEEKDSPRYGFLSGPVEVLRRAAASNQVQLAVADGGILNARVLRVNRMGMALLILEVQTT